MLIPRVIPCLLLRNKGLVKTVRFRDATYVGDPINAIRIFSEMGVDELIFLDIEATTNNSEPPFATIDLIASQCFMPVCYGGNIRKLEHIERMLALGIEKVSISSHAVENPGFIRKATELFGSQSVVVCMDVKKDRRDRHEVVTHNARRKTGIDPVEHALRMEAMGTGELIVNSVDRDGMMDGYDIDLIRQITDKVGIPVIACGGAGSLSDIGDVIRLGGASSAAAGSLFVFYGKLRGVLVNYPERKELESLFSQPAARRDMIGGAGP
ncbi:AglZ/HisF2 family acetamidino modification protein [Verrucomicrobiota bacterium]